MSQMNPKKFLYNTTFSVQLPYIVGHSLLNKKDFIKINIKKNIFPHIVVFQVFQVKNKSVLLLT